nr:immunoglobulin heavy chain junction region [Macaca mulatta]MOW19999.1 immunoglobulin heavy chain junction region [Macaca mulatta]MOW21179.1 immunoglobulin heavy chain junction region [Macaca mulatta]MOW22476.1 immunoglobulin heavy chain junction region [Macaca mulatta]
CARDGTLVVVGDFW